VSCCVSTTCFTLVCVVVRVKLQVIGEESRDVRMRAVTTITTWMMWNQQPPVDLLDGQQERNLSFSLALTMILRIQPLKVVYLIMYDDYYVIVIALKFYVVLYVPCEHGSIVE